MSSEYVTRTSLYLDSRWKSLNGWNFLKDIYIKFKETQLVEIASRVIHGSLRMRECRDESEIHKYQRIQLSNNKFINRILGGTLDLA